MDDVIETAVSQSTSNAHFVISLIVTTILSSGIIGAIIRFSGKLLSRFEAVEEGLKDVKQEQAHQARELKKVKRKMKTMQEDATTEVFHQVAERKRVLARDATE
jgi:hypothetical protein